MRMKDGNRIAFHGTGLCFPCPAPAYSNLKLLETASGFYNHDPVARFCRTAKIPIEFCGLLW